MKKQTATNDAARKAATEARLATMRANLDAIESCADAILSKGRQEINHAERLALLNLVNVGFHTSGKIEGVYSIDSTAACGFCARMRKAAYDNALMICGCCYAAADSWKEAAWRRHQLNARIMSQVLFTVDELTTLALPAAYALVRYNEDGDTVNVVMARNYLRIAAGRPEARFGYWYKNAPAVEAGLRAEGITCRDQLPKNVRFIHSSPLIGFPSAANWFDDAIFTVFPDQETTDAAIASGAHACNGRKCADCAFECYTMTRQASAIHIAEILRTNKARRAEILAAYNARKQQEAAAPQA